MQALIKPKKKPKILSKLPRTEQVIALFIPLLINKIKKIIITYNPMPTIRSRTYSLSIISFKYGFAFENKKRVTTQAKSHLDADKTLNTKPFFEHLTNERIVNTK